MQTCALSTGFSGAQSQVIMRFTSDSLNHLPDELNTRLASGRYRQAAVGACLKAACRDRLAAPSPLLYLDTAVKLIVFYTAAGAAPSCFDAGFGELLGAGGLRRLHLQDIVEAVEVVEEADGSHQLDDLALEVAVAAKSSTVVAVRGRGSMPSAKWIAASASKA